MREPVAAVVVGMILLGLSGCGQEPAAPKRNSTVSKRTADEPTVVTRDPSSTSEETNGALQPSVAANGKQDPGTAKHADDLELPPPPSSVTKTEAKTDTAKPADAISAGEVKLDVIDLAGFEKQIADLKGQFVAVDGWATWCIPCRQKFPNFVELSDKYRDKGVAFVSMSVDLEEDADKARKFLADQKAEFTNVLLKDELSEVQNKLKFTGVPVYLLYDRDGKIILNSSKLEDLEKKLSDVVK